MSDENTTEQAAERQELVLDLTLEGGAEVKITVEYGDDGTSAVQALRTFARDEYLVKLAVGLGLIPNMELVRADDDDEEF